MCNSVNRLSCGSTDQCCHVAYTHRHCEHCNQVIALAPPVCTRPHYPNWPANPWGQPFWWTNVGNPVGGLGVYQGNQLLTAQLTSGAGAQPALPKHACEAP